MIRRLYRRLPGPAAVRITLMVLAAIAALVALFFFYDWVGSRFLDSGGSIG